MLIPPFFLIEEMNKRHMSQLRLGELLNCRRPAVIGMLSGSKRLRKELKEIFPELSQKIDDHRIVLSCPLCGFGVVVRKKSVHCSRCYAFVCGDGLVDAMSKWNERSNKRTDCALCGGKSMASPHSITCQKCGFSICSAMGYYTAKKDLIKLWIRRYRVKTDA